MTDRTPSRAREESGPDPSRSEGAAYVPVVATARLTLRAHRDDDLDACAAMWADPVVVRHIGGRPSSRAQSWARLLTYRGLWPVLGYGYWAIEERATGRYVGDVGFADFRRSLVPSIDGVPELGWALASHAHGRGLATEAVLAVARWGDGHLEAARTVCLIDPANTASARVAAKCGFRAAGPAVLNDAATTVFERQCPSTRA